MKFVMRAPDDDLAAARARVQEQYDEAVERWFSEGRYEESDYDSPPGREIAGGEAEHWLCLGMGAVAGGGTFLLLWLRDDWPPGPAALSAVAAGIAVLILLGALIGGVITGGDDS